METARPILLLTRPEAQSRRFADAFRARFGADWPVVITPLTEIVWLSPALPVKLPAHVVFTSENAVRAFVRLTPDRSATAWCVGPRTQAVAEAAGFATRLGPGDGAGLARLIAASGEVRTVLYARPFHAAADLAGELKSAGIDTVSVVVYDQEARPLSDDAIRVLGGPSPVLLPLFSPRSASLAEAAVRDVRAPILLAAISGAVAQAARGIPALHSVTAARPDGEAMLDALGALIAAVKTG